MNLDKKIFNNDNYDIVWLYTIHNKRKREKDSYSYYIENDVFSLIEQ